MRASSFTASPWSAVAGSMTMMSLPKGRSSTGQRPPGASLGGLIHEYSQVT